jgi:hypothetical protein
MLGAGGGGGAVAGGYPYPHPPGTRWAGAPMIPHAPQVGPAERIARINSACLELVEGDVACGCYATFASVLSRFCQRAGVAQFEHLGLGPPIGVPCLRYLWDLQVCVRVRPAPAAVVRTPGSRPGSVRASIRGLPLRLPRPASSCRQFNR